MALPAAPRDRRRAAAIAIGTGIVGVIVLHLALGIVAEVSLYVRDPGYSDKEIRLARQEAANPGAPSVVMLGTSRTAAAFHAGRVRGQLAGDLGGRAMVFNFGIPASGPVTHLVYFRRLLADGHRPDLLLLEVLPPALADTPGGHGIPAGPLEARFLFGDRLRRSEVETVIRYDFPADETREAWRRSVTNPWYTLRFPLVGRVFPSALPWHLRFDWSRGCDEYGWGASFFDTVSSEQYAAGLKRAVGEYQGVLADFHPTGGAARALADLLALCRQQGIPVRLVLMPEAAGFRAIYPPAATERLYRLLHELCAEYGCELTDAREWLPDTAFSDGHHMLKPGAAAFSDRLLQEAIRPFFQSRGGATPPPAPPLEREGRKTLLPLPSQGRGPGG